MVEEEDGEFGLPGLTLGMSLEEVETAAALFPDAPQLELVEEREDAHFQTTISLYRMGAQTMLAGSSPEADLLGRGAPQPVPGAAGGGGGRPGAGVPVPWRRSCGPAGPWLWRTS